MQDAPLSEKRESQLLDQARRGDRGAMGELLNAYHRQVFHVCLRMVSHQEDAADVTQETLLKAAKNLSGFKGDARFRTWLFRIAMNQSISHLRKRKLRQTASLDQGASGEDGASAPLGGMMADEREPGPDQRVEDMDEIARVTAAVQRLDEGLKSVIILRDLQEMDYQQIADTLGVPVGTVKSRLFRARLALRAEITKTRPGRGASKRSTRETPSKDESRNRDDG